MAEPPPATPPPSPLAMPEPWDLVRDGYVAELWNHFSDFSRDALELADVADGSDVLDVCTGPGTLAVQTAARARRVVGVDFSPRMLEEFARRVRENGLRNVEGVEADGQALPFSDASFDAAFSMFGLIFFSDRAQGFRELFRVLRPGGCAVVSSWVPFDRVPPLRVAFDILAELMPEIPFGKGKAPLGQPEAIVEEMHAAGFESVEVRSVSHSNQAASPAAFWASMERSSAPFVLLRKRLGEEAWASISERVGARLTQHFGPGPLEIVPIALLGKGVRPARP